MFTLYRLVQSKCIMGNSIMGRNRVMGHVYMQIVVSLNNTTIQIIIREDDTIQLHLQIFFCIDCDYEILVTTL